MENTERKDDIYGEDIPFLDLRKYQLTELEGQNLLALDRGDLDRLLVALGNDDISLNLPIPCTRENVELTLSYSTCRKCGRCCTPNPLNPKSPGIEVFEDELQQIADYLHQPYEDLRKVTKIGGVTSYAFQVVKLGTTRWLPLPCPFYDQKDGCRGYEVRPVVCRTYPIIFTGDDSVLSIRATCEYGRDMIVGACERLRNEQPGLEIRL